MAVLVVMRWNPTGAGTDKYGDLSIIQVLDADQGPGAAVEANSPARFGFFYISDRDIDDPAIRRFMDQQTTGEGDERVIVRHRRWRGVRAAVPGDARRFTTYRPWNRTGASVPSNVKFRSAQVMTFLQDRAGG